MEVLAVPDTVSWADQGCTTAEIGCRDCKKALKESLLTKVAPIAERRAELENNPEGVKTILERGAERARAVAEETMTEVRDAIGIG